MERWLSRPRVLLGLCVVLLMASLNRQSPMVYGMFLFLATVSALGFAMPWLSVRSMNLRWTDGLDAEVGEGEAFALDLWVQRRYRWPAFVVTVEAQWVWADRSSVYSQTFALIRSGDTPALQTGIRFPCRGHYRLAALRLSSAFPLGLMRAQQTVLHPRAQVRVLPRAQTLQAPLPRSVTEDPLGELSTRKLGASYEPGLLRPYQPGEPVGRVSWRASARAGELIIQHYEHSGALRLRVVSELPDGAATGRADSAAEQAVRLCVGVCDAAQAQGMRWRAYVPQRALPLRDPLALRRALAETPASPGSLMADVARAAAKAQPGEPLVVVVTAGGLARQVLPTLQTLVARGCPVRVYIALEPKASPGERGQADALQTQCEAAGVVARVCPP